MLLRPEGVRHLLWLFFRICTFPPPLLFSSLPSCSVSPVLFYSVLFVLTFILFVLFHHRCLKLYIMTRRRDRVLRDIKDAAYYTEKAQ